MIQRKSVSDSIVDSIIEDIQNKKLSPGDKLPTEAEMAEEYGVSRISIREALRSLSAVGLVVTRHGEGSFINEYNPDMLASTLRSISLLDDTPVLEMLQLRKIMETEAARLCAENATKEELDVVQLYLKEREKYCRVEATSENIKKKYEMDKMFHLSIAKGSHNEIFIKFIETIHASIDIHQRESSKNDEQIDKATYFHQEIMSALLDHDKEKAGKMMYEHLANVEKNFRRSHDME